MKYLFNNQMSPAIRSLYDHDLFPPYLIAENRRRSTAEEETSQSTALLAAMLLLERLKLHILSGSYAYQDLCIFVVTCCGESVKVWKMVFDGEEKDEGRLIGYKMQRMASYDISCEESLKELGQQINHIHLYGLLIHETGVWADLNAFEDSRKAG